MTCENSLEIKQLKSKTNESLFGPTIPLRLYLFDRGLHSLNDEGPL